MRAARWFIMALFSVVVAYFGWRTFGPVTNAEYRVEATQGFGSPWADQKLLHLRRTLHLAERPQHAWIELLADGRLDVFVNGSRFAKPSKLGDTQAVVADITSLLREGRNVIAVSVMQTQVDRPPVVAIRGAYLVGGEEHSLGDAAAWRAGDTFEREAAYWIMPEFDDAHWIKPTTVERALSSNVAMPPDASRTSQRGQWIMAPDGHARSVAMRRDWTIAGEPQQAWLRLTTGAAYRLAINGDVVDVQEWNLAADRPSRAVMRTYDLTPLVHQGENSIAVQLTSSVGAPAMLAELESIDREGNRYQADSDETWLYRAGRGTEWLESSAIAGHDWEVVHAESGDFSVPPWEARRVRAAVTIPVELELKRAAIVAGLALGVFVATALVVGVLGWLAARLAGDRDFAVHRGAFVLALALPTLGLGTAWLAVFDTRIDAVDVYRGEYLIAALVAVAAFWLLLFIAAGLRRLRLVKTRSRLPAWQMGWFAAPLVLGMLVAGTWLRATHSADEPLNPDEVGQLKAAEGIFERGFPSVIVHADQPVLYAATSELSYFATAAGVLMFDNDLYAVRIPCVVLGMMTALLLFFVGRRLFGTPAGLVAMTLYTFSPVCIVNSNFGRYFSILQFFILLTVYLFWRTIEDRGRVRHGALWLCAASFACMYLSWEGVALIAPGMIIAALVHCRGHLRAVLYDRSVWTAMLVVLAVVLVQTAHRNWRQSERLWYGTGASDVAAEAMWEYPHFDPMFYFWNVSWNRDLLIPILGLFGACMLAVGSGVRRPTRFLLIILASNCLLMTLVLSVRATRYGYHLIPITILLSSVSLVAAVRICSRLSWHVGMPQWRYAYGRGIGWVAALAVIVIGSGITLRPAELRFFAASAPDIGDLRFPDQTYAIEYVRHNFREGDVLMATVPHVCSYLLDQPTDYWVETKLHLQATLDDKRSVPLHRSAGTVMLPNVQAIDDVFARNGRIWFVSVPAFHAILNTESTSAYLREHMDVVYEDFATAVFFRGDNQRTAELRQRSEADLRKSGNHLLPPIAERPELAPHERERAMAGRRDREDL